MLAGSDYQQQIIQANSFARFRIVLEGLYCGRIDQIINYSINGQHNFQLLVEAEVELVALQISKPNLKLSYSDEVSDMLLKDNFVLKN